MKCFFTVPRSVAVLVVLLAPLCASAAKICFGSGETLHYVASTALKSPDGETLLLSRKFTRECFVFPYSQSDDGFVLAVEGKPSRYYRLPSAPEIARLQEAGLLPKPFPEWKIGAMQFIGAYLLWFVLGACVVYALFVKLRRRSIAA